MAAAGLATDLTQTWRTHVSADLDRRPISEWEVDAVAENMSTSSLALLASRPEVAYGSTLVAAVLAPAYVLYLQLGDGDILEVDAGGAAAHAPLPADPLLHGNETTSLCMPNAWSHVRIGVRPVNADGPACIMLSTDGYANSFADATGSGPGRMRPLRPVKRTRHDRSLALPAGLAARHLGPGQRR